MIKLYFDSETALLNQYFLAIKDIVLQRLEHTRIFSGIILGKIDSNIIDRENYRSIGALGSKLLEIVEFTNKEKEVYPFTKIADIPTSLIQLAHNEKLETRILIGLYNFSLFLLKEENLEELIKCPATQLRLYNKELVEYFFDENIDDSKYCRMLIDYESFNDINAAIKGFSQNLKINTCPYCNIGNIQVQIREADNKVMNGPEIDHFFDKATYPLLGYSFYNLIPSCGVCNGPRNKRKIPFTEDFHMNPFIEGFKKDAVFKPVPHRDGTIGKYQIVIDIRLASDTDRYRKMLGDGIDLEKGNINVFGLKEKYRDMSDYVAFVESKFDKNGPAYLRSINDFMKQIEAGNSKQYFDVFGCHYDPQKFTQTPYSKLTRDLFDNYIGSLKKRDKRFVLIWWENFF